MNRESEARRELCEKIPQSVFYSNAGLDGKPMAMLSTRYTTFINVDWNITQDDVRADVGSLKGYELEAIDEMDLDALIPAGWRSSYVSTRRKPAYAGPYGDMPEEPFRIKWCLHAHWRRRPAFGEVHGRERLELYYFGGEGTLVYEALYTRLGINPAAIAIIQPGGGNGSAVWTHIEKAGGFFHQLVKSTAPTMPDVLLFGGNGHHGPDDAPCWPEYEAAGKAARFFGEYHVRNDPLIGDEDGFQASVLEYRLRAATS